MSDPASLAETDQSAPGPPQVVDYRIVDDSFVTRRWILGVLAGVLGSSYLGLVVGLGAVELSDAESLMKPAAVAVILACTAVYTWFVTRIIRRVTVGKDGVTFRSGYGWRKTFVAFAELDGVEDPGRFRPLAELRTLDLRLRDGTTFTIGAGSPDRVGTVVGALRAALQTWREGQERTMEIEGLRKDTPRVDAWVAGLRKRAAADDAYRDATFPFGELGAVVANPSASPSQRLGAAVVLAARGAEEAREQLRDAARDTANPRLRIALESVARDDDARVVEEHLAAALEEPEARRASS